MRCLVAFCLGLSVISAIGGCRSCDRVESELRARENDVRELRDELDRCSVYNQTLQQEVHSLRGQLGVPPDGPPPAAYPVQKMTIGPRSGGRSNNVCPGDDALQVQLEPRDPDNHVIKAPGQALIQVQEITSEGIKRPLSSWIIPPDQLRKSWVNGLLTTGYLLNLPWRVWPSTEKLRLTATFQLADGRVFEADRDVAVRLTPANQRPTLVPKSDANPPPEPPAAPNPSSDGGPALLPAPQLIGPSKPETPPPSQELPGPFLGVSRTKPNAPLKPDKVLEASPAEILRPVPLK